MLKSREGNVSVTEIAAYIVAPLLTALNGVLLWNYRSLQGRVAEGEKTSREIKDNYISRFEKVHAISGLQVKMGETFIAKADLPSPKSGRRGR